MTKINNVLITSPPPPQGDTYFTVHVTPQQECSYVSFETNLERDRYGPLITQVLQLFQPGRCTLTLFASKVGMSTTLG